MSGSKAGEAILGVRGMALVVHDESCEGVLLLDSVTTCKTAAPKSYLNLLSSHSAACLFTFPLWTWLV